MSMASRNVSSEAKSGEEEEEDDLEGPVRRWRNPFKMYMAHRVQKRLEKENALLLREERMNEDLERHLMQIEEHRCWVVFQLGHLNFERMKKAEVVNKLMRREKKRSLAEKEEWKKENGLSYFLGAVQSYKKWQNSPAKYLDYTGHIGAVTACKLSPCQQYLLSCSEDRTLKLWNIETGECLKTLVGHLKVVNDVDFHADFKMFRRHAGIVSGSGDGTLKIWNGSNIYAMLTLYGHTSAVYRVAFSPDGKTLASCSEDRTVRTWCFPEGYCLYIYSGHASGVTTVKFSDSGRYLASGSDYGERKILLWKSKLPDFREPEQFPHIFFWTPEGVIKKIVMRKTVPRPNFWLAQTQLRLINDDSEFDIWPGEVSDIEEDDGDEDSDADGDDDSKSDFNSTFSKDKTESHNQDDLKELKGVTLRVTHVSGGGEQSEATEYNPGGFLVISVQSAELDIAEAFLDAMSKSSRYESFDASAGHRLGKFDLDAPVPWLPMKKTVDFKGRIRYSREPPKGFMVSKNDQCVIFRESLVKKTHKYAHLDHDPYTLKDKDGENDETLEEYKKKFDIVWTCPVEENLGTVVIVVNVKLRNSQEWIQLRYSVKESAIRMNAVGELKMKDVGGKRAILFDQEERHRLFWKYIREKDYQMAAAFIDRRAMCYTASGSIYRRFRIINLLVSMFDECPWLILHSPFIFKTGVTKSVVLCETNFDEGAGEDEEEAEEEQVIEEEEIVMKNDGNDPPFAQEEEELGDLQVERIDSHVSSHAASEASGARCSASYSLHDEENELKEDLDIVVEEEKEGESRVKTSENAPVSMLALGVKSRSTTTKRNIALIATRELTEKEYKNEVESLAYELTSELVGAEDSKMTCAKELGLRCPAHFLFHIMSQNIVAEEQMMMKADLNSCEHSTKLTLYHDYYDKYDVQDYLVKDFVEDLKDLQLNRPIELSKEEQKAMQLEHAEALESSDMIKTGKYGPDIDDFSMPLPSFFPLRAGQARYALENAIVRYASTISKIEKEQLPTTLEEVYVPTIKERTLALYHRLNRTEYHNYRNSLQEFFRMEAKRRLLEDKVYVGSRRQSYIYLPGLNRHYPNRNYPEPALLLPGIDFLRPERSKLTFVGRLLGRKVVQSHISPPVGRKPRHLSGLSALRWAAEVVSYQAKQGTELYQWDKVDYEADALGNLIAQDEKESMLLPRGGFLGFSKRDESKQKLKRSRKRKKKKVLDVLKEGYPRGCFTGRRGSYPLAPGLQDFVVQDLTLKTNRQDSNLIDQGQEEPEGLVRRFTVNGFELAHHGSVNDIAFAPSETRLVTAGGDGLIKIWDPRDGSFVRSLHGHKGEVKCVHYTRNEQFLVSCGADSQIIIWSLLTRTIQRKLKGHVDVVNMITITGDCSLILSASHDGTIKSWYTTPRHPATPSAPRIVTVAHDSVMISWNAPPCFNLDITAFHLQYRVGIRESWVPSVSTNLILPAGQYATATDDRAGICIGPHIRTKTINHLIPATYYQFRVRAENRMGMSDWSQPSPLTMTEFGLPEAPERPLIVSVGIDFVQLVWLTPNPETFGSAAMSFQVQCQGNDLTFNDREPVNKKDKKSVKINDKLLLEDEEKDSTVAYSLEQVKEEGQRVLWAFQKVYERFEQSKKKLKKSELFSVMNRQSIEEEKELAISKELPSDSLFQLLERSKDRTQLLVSAKYTNLHPGFLYGFRVRGMNQVGKGPWSAVTLTIGTLPTLPNTPEPPVLKQFTLRSITLQWNPPSDDGGSAVIGYTIHLLNTDKYIELGRSTVQFTWEGLFPGKSYRMRVAAKNMVGTSNFSEPNSMEHSFTSIAPPEQPSAAPIAVAGSWNELTYEISAPYSNGAKIESMLVQYRLITAFAVGNWETPSDHPSYPVQRLLYKETTIVKTKANRFTSHKGPESTGEKQSNQSDEVLGLVEFIDTERQQKELEETVAKLELIKNSTGFNRDKAKLEAEIEALISTQKPSGSRLNFRLRQLQPDSMYEVRVCFVNRAGQGAFSQSSHRAKTNQASPPAACAVPNVMRVGQKYILLEVTVPHEGGAPVRFFNIECMDLDDSTIIKLRMSRNALDLEIDVQYRVENLRAGGSYIVRCCAESSVGAGPFSPWTKEIELLPIQSSATASTSSK